MSDVKATILVIDDETIVQESCKRILGPEGYRVETAFTGQEAFGKLSQGSCDLVITDLKMPGISGMEALKKIKHDDPDIGIIMITGYATPETAVEAMKLGAFDYLPKPFTPDELLATVSKALEKKRILTETKHLDKAYRDATASISSSLNLNEVLTLIARSVVSLLKLKGCSVHLYDEAAGTLTMRASCGISDSFLARTAPDLETLLHETLGGTELFIADVQTDARTPYLREARHEGIVSLLFLPLRTTHTVIGVLRAYSAERRHFAEQEMELLRNLARQAGIAALNAKIYQDVREDYERLQQDLPPSLKNRSS